MKKLLLLVMALVGSVSAFAQVSDIVTATLQTDEGTTVFYGYESFASALNAAPAEGSSTITLSPGTFKNPGGISKNVKIYGAGFEDDVVNKIPKTCVEGDIYVSSTNTLSPVVHLEGIYFKTHIIVNGKQSISDLEIVKCCFECFYQRQVTNNTIIRQCYIRTSITGENYECTQFLVANCWMLRFENFLVTSTVNVDHCIIAEDYYGLACAVYTNNIINSSNTYRIAAGSTCKNNVSTNFRLDVGGHNNCTDNYDVTEWQSFENLFADGQNDLAYYLTDTTTPRTWVLKEPDTYKGTDGKPCGVSGGHYPWNFTPVIPRIYSTTVDSESEFGKLNVTIKAEAGSAE